MSVERRGWVIRTGTIMGQLETGGARRFQWRAAALRDGTSRVMGDCQARICEGLGVKFPGSTRHPGLSSCEIIAIIIFLAKSIENLGCKAVSPFHEKAGECQVGFSFSVDFSFSSQVEVFAVEPSRLCRHPSIRTLC